MDLKKTSEEEEEEGLSKSSESGDFKSRVVAKTPRLNVFND
jgi:hypothetical protein